jgi:hypothetical protein
MVFVGIAMDMGCRLGDPSRTPCGSKAPDSKDDKRRLEGAFCRCVKQIRTVLQLAPRPASRSTLLLGSSRSHPVSRSAAEGG